MTRFRPLAVLALLAAGPPLAAQTEAKPAFGLSLSGFVKTDILYDTRQTVSLREGHFLLYPKAPLLDGDGRDVNAASSFHMLSIQTRLMGRITGPDAWGAKTSGLVEAEFFGTSDADLNGFRLRHAFVRLAWPRTEVLAGQFWHPMFVTDSFPDVVSFNTGAPFQPFNRSPQIRITRRLGAWSLTAAACAQRDFASNGPDGASSAYARNAAVPELDLQLQVRSVTPGGGELLAGAGGGLLRIRPRLATPSGFATDGTLTSGAGQAFVKLTSRRLILKAMAVYGGNLHHLTMIGGYAVAGLGDAARDLVTYAALRTLSLWGEAQTNGERVQAGLFAGYSANLGAEGGLAGPVYARGDTIARLWRLAPRLTAQAGKVRLAAEIEVTAAAYGAPDSRGIVRDPKSTTNLRLLGAIYYFF